MIDKLKPISLPNDFRMIPGNKGQVFGKTNLAIVVAADSNDRIGSHFDVSLQRAFNMNELNDDNRFVRHMIILSDKIWI